MKVLAKRLKEARENAGYKQIDAAKKLGISNGTLSGYERSYRDPDTDILNKMADLYEVSVDWLLGKSDKPNQTEEEEFQAFINDPELERWYRELPKSKEEDLRRLRKIWQIIKEKENKED